MSYHIGSSAASKSLVIQLDTLPSLGSCNLQGRGTREHSSPRRGCIASHSQLAFRCRAKQRASHDIPRLRLDGFIRGKTRLAAHRVLPEKRNAAASRSGAAVASIDVFVLGFEGVLAEPENGALYEGVAEALSTTSMPYYIVSSQSAASVSKALKEYAGVNIPADSPRILSTTDRMDAWKTISSKPLAQDPANTVHLVDGHSAALEQASANASFAKWQLYLATWGAGQEEKTSRGSRIRPAGLKDFPELLRWGLLMGVNDGCQEYEDGTPAA